MANSDKRKRFTFYVDASDEQLIEWWDNQANKSESVRALIMDSIHLHGMKDVVELRNEVYLSQMQSMHDQQRATYQPQPVMQQSQMQQQQMIEAMQQQMQMFAQLTAQQQQPVQHEPMQQAQPVVQQPVPVQPSIQPQQPYVPPVQEPIQQPVVESQPVRETPVTKPVVESKPEHHESHMMDKTSVEIPKNKIIQTTPPPIPSGKKKTGSFRDRL